MRERTDCDEEELERRMYGDGHPEPERSDHDADREADLRRRVTQEPPMPVRRS